MKWSEAEPNENNHKRERRRFPCPSRPLGSDRLPPVARPPGGDLCPEGLAAVDVPWGVRAGGVCLPSASTGIDEDRGGSTLRVRCVHERSKALVCRRRLGKPKPLCLPGRRSRPQNRPE